MLRRVYISFFAVSLALLFTFTNELKAQKYPMGVIDKPVAVIGNEIITIGDIEQEVQIRKLQGATLSDKKLRCDILESLMELKLFLMQARLDSLKINSDMVESTLSQRLDQIRTQLGGDNEVEKHFSKPLYKLREEWRKQLQDMNLTQQQQSSIVSSIAEVRPLDVKHFADTIDKNKLPLISRKYRLSQICIYPDRELAKNNVKEKLLAIRKRILNGEKFSTMARLYSEDKASARKGGELGLASKSLFWPVFSDAAMSLKKSAISQIVETPDGFHLIEVLEKKGDMFNARHILIKPKYTTDDRTKAFSKLDSLRTEIITKNVDFGSLAQQYSEDVSTKNNKGQMTNHYSGSSFFEIDQLKPADYLAIKDLEEGEVSMPLESLDNEGREGNTVYKIIKVEQIIPSHTATFEQDFVQLQEMLKVSLQQKAIEEYLNKKINDTYIVIDPLFESCLFKREIWNKQNKASKQ